MEPARPSDISHIYITLQLYHFDLHTILLKTDTPESLITFNESFILYD